MKKLSIGIQTFSKLLEENCIYVDKTNIIHQLITTGSCYFFSRPRRFGKSLLVSTLAEIFSGNRKLFSGLAIDSLPYAWEQHPVVMLSFAGISYITPENLEKGIKVKLQDIANQQAIAVNAELTPGEMLGSLIKQLAQKNRVALLVDEYDYAILQHIHNPQMADAIRETLKNFYSVIKDLDPYLKFVFLTGVSKFPKTSIFSGLNNLDDISLDADYNTLLGYTKTEILSYFEEYIIKTANHNKYSTDQLLEDIKLWYDGYKFTIQENALNVYNPFSVLLLFKKGDFANYWFETGTPTFLINILKNYDYPMQEFESIEATQSELGRFEIKNIPIKALLFQTGYLAIRSYNPTTKNYVLGYANKETVDSLSSLILSSMTHIAEDKFNSVTANLLQIFETSNLPALQKTLTTLFAAIPYGIHVSEEKYYQTIFYLLLKMIGANIIVEQQTNIGRIDAVVETKNSYFIIEFKINSSATKAIAQIEEKKYYEQYQSNNKKITLIGIAFETTTRNISSIEYKEM